MSAMASQITDVSIVYSTVCSGADQRKHQSSASLAFVNGIKWWPVNTPHKGASNVENVSIWWRHHCFPYTITECMETLTTNSYHWCTLLEKMLPRAINYPPPPFGIVVEAMFMMFLFPIHLGWHFHLPIPIYWYPLMITSKDSTSILDGKQSVIPQSSRYLLHFGVWSPHIILWLDLEISSMHGCLVTIRFLSFWCILITRHWSSIKIHEHAQWA